MVVMDRKTPNETGHLKNEPGMKDAGLKTIKPAFFMYITSFLLAFSGLSAWVIGKWQTLTFGSGYIPMAPSTALAIMMLSASAAVSQSFKDSRTARIFTFVSIICILFTCIIVILTEMSYYQDFMNEILSTQYDRVNGIPVGKMSPLTALVLIFSTFPAISEILSSKLGRVAIHAALSGAVIATLLCAAILISYAAGTPALYGGNTVPMAILTAFGLIILNSGSLIEIIINKFQEKTADSKESAGAMQGIPSSRIPAIFLIAVSLAIILGGITILKEEIEHEKKKTSLHLSIISDLKAAQISEWYSERVGDAEVIKKSPAIQAQLSRFLRDSSNENDRSDLIEWMNAINETYGYNQAILYDSSGSPRLWTGKTTMGIIGSDDIRFFWECLHNKKTYVNGLHTHENVPGGQINMSVLIPVETPSARSKDKSADGVLMLHIDPYIHLYPMIQTWPLESQSAETLLVIQEGGEVLFLNELRHKKNTALSFRLPLRDDLPATMAVKGQRGVVEGKDYREKLVMAALNRVEGTPWFMVSKIDAEEIYAPIIHETWTGIGIIICLIIIAAMFFFVIERQRISAFYRKMAEKNKENLEIREAFIESQRHFRNIFEQAAVGICYTDLDGRFEKVNSRFCEITGYSNEDLLSMNFHDITHPEDIPEEKERIGSLLDGDASTYSMEKRYVKKNGETVWVDLTISIDTSENKDSSYLIGIAEDITNKKAALDALIISEERYASTLDAVNDGIWDWDVVGGQIFFSNHYYNMLGYRQDELVHDQSSVFNLMHPEDLGLVKRKIAEAVRTAGGFDIDLRMMTKDGQWKWVSSRGRTTKKTDIDSSARMIGTLSDISARKTAENLILEEKERLLVTLRSIGDGVITTDTNARIILMNKVAEDLTGWSMNEAEGRPLDEILCLYHEYSRKTCENPAIKVLSTGEIIEFEANTLLKSKDGTERSIEDSAAPIRDSMSRIIGVVIVFRDITEKHKTEEALQNAQKLESLSILAGGIAHDFNNLLGGIFGYLDMALEFAQEQDFKGAQSTISSALGVFERARDLTRQLLTFSKGGAPVRRTELISDIVKESVSFALTGSNVAMFFDIPENIWNCHIDKNQIGQVIDNIVINARQAMPSGGTLKASLSNISANEAPAMLKPNNYVKISLKDNGPGIPKEHLPHIFDPFFTTKKQGNGLGLATCYSIIKRHEGLIEVKTLKDEGTTFHIYLPAAKDETAVVKEGSTYDFKGNGKILVMDDEPPMLKVTSAMLEKFGYIPVTARDGDEAVNILRKAVNENDGFFAAILDLTVPGGRGGKDIVSELKEIDPLIKLVASSGYSGDSIMADPEKYGFISCLAKPFRISELARVLESIS